MSRAADWEGVRLHVVTGKGGTGKTTVAGALAVALAADGGQVLVVEVESRQGLSQVFDVAPLGYDERRLLGTFGGGEVHGLAVDPEAALLEYLDMFYKLGRAGRVLDRIGAVDFATTIAPGMRDVLLTGKVYEAVRRPPARGGPRSRDGRSRYDAVVLDAPPTGRVTRFLNVSAEVVGLARVGPIKAHAESIATLVQSPETAVHVVTHLEEMPVQETCDAAEELRAAGLGLGAVIVNAVRQPVLSAGELTAAGRGRLDREAVVKGLDAAGAPATDEVVDGLLAGAREHAERVRLERRERATLAGLGAPTYELPLLAHGVDVGGVYRLAELLREQGAA